jgi:hypothetical protein
MGRSYERIDKVDIGFITMLFVRPQGIFGEALYITRAPSKGH